LLGEEIAAKVLKAADKNREWRKEAKVSSGKEVVFLNVFSRPILIDQERMILVRLSDVTAIKRSELELADKNKELTRLNRLMVGREHAMIKMKKELNLLKSQLGGEKDE